LDRTESGERGLENQKGSKNLTAERIDSALSELFPLFTPLEKRLLREHIELFLKGKEEKLLLG
jgi:hypothetical protein